MSHKLFIALWVLVSIFHSAPSFSEDHAPAASPVAASRTSPAEWVEWSSAEGIRRFQNAKDKAAFFALANYFQAQENGVECGSTSGAIVLNALRLPKKSASLPTDKSTVSTEEYAGLNPPGAKKVFNPYLARYTPQTFFNAATDTVKTRAEVFGKKNESKDTEGAGFSMNQLAAMFVAHETRVEKVHVSPSVSVDDVREAMAKALSSPGKFIVVNFQRKAFEPHQTGGGHFSPVGAYDRETDSFLVLDVNPTKSPWVWISAPLLTKGMQTKDGNEYRGYLVVSEK